MYETDTVLMRHDTIRHIKGGCNHSVCDVYISDEHNNHSTGTNSNTWDAYGQLAGNSRDVTPPSGRSANASSSSSLEENLLFPQTVVKFRFHQRCARMNTCKDQ
ncbi:hypothetical protein MSG28_008712 [Choristoneura fumiferana]|uniref:Uncharacterized protein n=1 Tax=Choristoneura fumiferana TaxID=7141 RepID=A0ACC0J7T9_CHOFU|nr:hypothetical protein MSG28_008712 [Choristoneura fumiferana]